MVSHFTIRPPRDFEQVLSESIKNASSDPCILHFNRGPAGHLFLFCHTPEVVEQVRQLYERERRVSAGICYLIFLDGEIRADLECLPDSVNHIAGFVKWLLATYGPCQLYDEDQNKEIGDTVATDPDVLFRFP